LSLKMEAACFSETLLVTC